MTYTKVMLKTPFHKLVKTAALQRWNYRPCLVVCHQLYIYIYTPMFVPLSFLSIYIYIYYIATIANLLLPTHQNDCYRNYTSTTINSFFR